MEHLAETMTDFLLRHKYITEEQAEWCHYIYIECGDCQRAASRSCKNLLCAFDTAGAPVIVPVHDVEYLFSTTVDKSECRAILTKANFCELYKGWIDGRDDHTIEMWSEKQCYIAAGNMMTAAALIGIDSCPIEGFLSDKVDAILGIDTSVYQSALVIPFGYKAQDARGKHRLSFDEVVEFKK